MSIIKDLANQRFGRLIAMRSLEKRAESGHIIWLCKCDCGNSVRVISNNLVRGNTESCGCLNRERSAGFQFKHGDAIHGKVARLYDTWASMKGRCLNPNKSDYKWYGERGILVCKEWESNYLIFKDWALANGYRNNLTIDRIDNDGDYEPENCQWIEASENIKKVHQERRRRNEKDYS